MRNQNGKKKVSRKEKMAKGESGKEQKIDI
jgi:hypothetical protein